MKRNIFFWLLIGGILAGSGATAQQSKIILSGSRFTYPLVERWISEYAKINPQTTIKINPRGGADADSANLIINAHELELDEVRPGYKVVNIGRYVLLPVTNVRNPRLQEYLVSGISEKSAKRIFFDKYEPFEDQPTKKVLEKDKALLNGLTIYTREQKACAPTTFARHYGFEQADIRGKRIGGDDKHLIQVVLKDTTGLTYNSPVLIYDLKSRKVKDGLAVLPIDLNGNGKLDEDEKIYDNLDNLIASLEQKQRSEIAYGNINLSFPQDPEENKELTAFVLWILKEGQQYIHEYSFLNLKEDVLNKQISILSNP